MSRAAKLGEIAVDPEIQGKVAGLESDWALAGLAERQHGVVAREQLLTLGLGPGAIEHRLRRGRLHRVHRGVYALVKRVPTREGRWMAAVLAAGPNAVLSHRSAADLWGLGPFARRRSEVTVGVRRRAGPDVEVHCAALREDELTERHGIPVTTATRTLLDLAAVLPRHRVERALREAELQRLGDAASLGRLLQRHPRRRGTATLRSILASGRTGENVTRSELEERFLLFVGRAALPRPNINAHVEIAGRLIECDCVWPRQGLIVELDGHAAHGRRSAFEADRARDRAFNAAGWRVVRVTWRQLDRETTALVADLRSLLTRAGDADL